MNPSALPAASSRRAGSPSTLRIPAFRRLLVAFVAGLLVTAGAARAASAGPAADSFMPYVQLAPFVVNGQQLAISIHARTGRDRRYAQDFAEDVVKVVYEAVTPSTGKGLVIIGRKGEPHPIFVFRQFLALAQAGRLDPAVAAHGPELVATLDRWREVVNDEQGRRDQDDREFEKIITALPLPLAGIGAKLYQVAWAEGFDAGKLEAKLCALRAADLEDRLFTHFDWVFYLPPKKAFDQALDELVADAVKEDGAGFFARVAIKGVLVVVKPRIRRAIEAVRQGLLFMTVVQARTAYDRDQVGTLTSAYVETLVPDDDEGRPAPAGGSDHDRAVAAVRRALSQLKPPAPVPTATP
ncbi:MAG TPA: hypothetical protein VL200_04235 [Lacunisphaera sp.]|nr:hypothetical protein [Lacunisphaera sp.]